MFISEGESCTINPNGPQEVSLTGETSLHFTYSVEWHQSDIKWASRWDVYLEMSDTQIHWFSIINSVVVVFFLSGIITMIIIRTLRKDIAKYNMADEESEDSIEETGWKLVHGDVFRPPYNNKLFAAVIGSGIQIFTMLAITIFFAMLGMLSPASRGALLTAAIFFYEFLGLVAGYYSGRLYRTMKGKEWKVKNNNQLILSLLALILSIFCTLRLQPSSPPPSIHQLSSGSVSSSISSSGANTPVEPSPS